MIWRKQNRRVRRTISGWIRANDSEVKSTRLQLQLSVQFLSLWFGPNPKPPMNCCKSSVVVNRAIGIFPWKKDILLSQNAHFRQQNFPSICTKHHEDVLLGVSGEKVSLVITRRRIRTRAHTQKSRSPSLKQLWGKKHESTHDTVIKYKRRAGQKSFVLIFPPYTEV